MQPYKEGLREKWGVKKFNLDDLYVRFFRISERRIADGTGKGIICFISNYSWLSGASYVVMRQRLTERFDRIWIDCMNGDSRETGKLTPEGKPDPSVFSTERNREGIRVGTAIALMGRTETQGVTPRSAKRIVKFRQFWGANKRAALLAEKNFDAGYETLAPTPENRFSLRPGAAAADYAAWPALPDLAAIPPLNGLMEKRGGALMADDRATLEARMNIYLDRKQPMAAVRRAAPGLAEDRAAFIAKKSREIAQREGFRPELLKRYWLRPFEHCTAYVTQASAVWNRSRPDL